LTEHELPDQADSTVDRPLWRATERVNPVSFAPCRSARDAATCGSPDKAQAWIDDALENKKVVMGFGHRVYRKGDSRVPTMHKAFLDMAKIKNGEDWVKIEEIVEKTMVEKKGIYPNLDYPTGPAYYMMGFDIDLFTPLFVMSRITGWTAHIIEQLDGNKLIRPLSGYNGVPQRAVKPIGARG
jgi:citrate synthase